MVRRGPKKLREQRIVRIPKWATFPGEPTEWIKVMETQPHRMIWKGSRDKLEKLFSLGLEEGFINAKTPKECFLAQWKIEGENESETASEVAEYRNCRIEWLWTHPDLLWLLRNLGTLGLVPARPGWETIQDSFSTNGNPIAANTIKQESKPRTVKRLIPHAKHINRIYQALK